MTQEPAALEANIYMEICAALMTAAGVTEIEISLKDVPMKPFQIWRRMEDEKLIVRLIWEDSQTLSQANSPGSKNHGIG